MASISAIGIAFAAPIVALAALPAAWAQAERPHTGRKAALDITVRGIRSSQGVIRLAVCPRNAGFPDCKGREVRSASLPIANGQASVRFSDLDAGSYGISVFHDANANGKLDTLLGIPKEGYGFSRNPPFRPRAPRFSEVELHIDGASLETITLRYIL